MDEHLQIVVCRGTGEGGTTLSAFDAALADAGVANLNLVVLSSVVPPGAVVSRAKRPDDALVHLPGTEWGDRLYCVMAEARTAERGSEAWAGIAWWQHNEDRRGVFVEHHGSSEAEVSDALRCSLGELVGRRGHRLGDGCHDLSITGARCVDRPVCSLVVATYETQGWTPSA